MKSLLANATLFRHSATTKKIQRLEKGRPTIVPTTNYDWISSRWIESRLEIKEMLLLKSSIFTNLAATKMGTWSLKRICSSVHRFEILAEADRILVGFRHEVWYEHEVQWVLNILNVKLLLLLKENINKVKTFRKKNVPFSILLICSEEILTRFLLSPFVTTTSMHI